uniref:Uncharacterized protein n=1 Tax=viral metagenome TaxID=1070528 RepID=A0A6C0BCW6_9ZZZZ
MGFYETIFNCEDGNYCVSIGSTYDDFHSKDDLNWCILCDKHRDIKIGSKFKYNFGLFIEKFEKRSLSSSNSLEDQDVIKDVEVVDMKDFTIKNGIITIIRFKTDLDLSNLDESKKINFSMFGNEEITSWDDDIITTQFFKSCIHRELYRGSDIFYNWKTNKIVWLS